jgi:hypothetical protein
MVDGAFEEVLVGLTQPVSMAATGHEAPPAPEVLSYQAGDLLAASMTMQEDFSAAAGATASRSCRRPVLPSTPSSGAPPALLAT